MKCIYCKHLESKVLDSRSAEDNTAIRRRRECLKCARRFTTYEIVETTPILVVKSDLTREQFDKNKIKAGLIRACEKRPVSLEKIEAVVDTVSKKVQEDMSQEIKTSDIGEHVMEELKKLDDVAYVRFASVYRKFTDVTTFVQFINERMGEAGATRAQNDE